MTDIVHEQFMESSSYLAQIQEQFRLIEKQIENGKVVTLNLADNGDAISLIVSRDEVIQKEAPIETNKTRGARPLAENNRLLALATNTFAFDVGEANRKIQPAHLEAQIANTRKTGAFASAERHTRSAAGLPIPKVSYIGNEWVVADDFTYPANDGFNITAKSGFKTDLASIPRFLWGFLASFELSLAGSIFHDLIYRSGGRVMLPAGEVSPADKIFSREEADDLFLEMMTRNKDRYWKGNVAYLAVRWFGKSSWRGLA
jgi:hypothetical protein